MAVEAVDPASLFWVFSDFKNSESVWLYASAAEEEKKKTELTKMAIEECEESKP